jgi:RTX toxin RtxA
MSGNGVNSNIRVGNVGGLNGAAPADGNINASLVSRASRQVNRVVQNVRESLPTINIPSPAQIGTSIADAFRNLRARNNAPVQINQESSPQTRARAPLTKYMAKQAFGTEESRRDTAPYEANLQNKVDTGLSTRVEITNSKGDTLRGYFHNANATEEGKLNTDKVVLFLSGSGGSSEEYSEHIVNKYTNEGVSVMAVNYRGFGQSEGVPSERGLYRDAKSMFDHLVNDKGIDPQNIIIHGFSLGGPIATDLVKQVQAEGVDVKGLILDRPMASMKGASDASMGGGFLGGIAGSLSKKYLGEFSIDKKLASIERNIPIILTTDREDLHDIGEELRGKAQNRGFTVVGQSYDLDHENSRELMNKVSYWNNIRDNLLT